MDDAENDDSPEPTYEEWVQEQIGPRQVGGRYYNHYGGQAYTVLAIDPGPRNTWPVWNITVIDDGATEPKSHCTAWDPRDRVL